MRRVRSLLLALAVVALSVAPAMAQYTPPTSVTPIDLNTQNGIATVVNWTNAGIALGVAGASALGTAFFLGGGFRIAKKGFAWALNKI